MEITIKGIKETVRINKAKLSIKLMVAGGKQGDHFVLLSPSLLISGYGSNMEEAKDSFKLNVQLFCKDLMTLSNEQRDIELKKLGFSREKFHNKNFSKLYVDGNGVLQGFEAETLQHSMIEATV